MWIVIFNATCCIATFFLLTFDSKFCSSIDLMVTKIRRAELEFASLYFLEQIMFLDFILSQLQRSKAHNFKINSFMFFFRFRLQSRYHFVSFLFFFFCFSFLSVFPFFYQTKLETKNQSTCNCLNCFKIK